MTATSLRELIVTVCLCFCALAGRAGAESPADVPRVGLLLPSGDFQVAEDGLRQGLVERGFVVGKDVTIDTRRYGGSKEELRALVGELIGAKVQLIVGVGTLAALAAMDAIPKVPVVFLAGDPTATGLAASLARPAANATGVSILSAELTAKRLQYLHEFAPKASRIAYLANSSNPVGVRQRKEAQKAARALGLKLTLVDVRNADELSAALQVIRDRPADGYLISGDGVLFAHRNSIAHAVTEKKRPTIFPWSEYHENGALMSYGPSMREAARLVAGYVDKILKGANPSELPIQQISRFELIIDKRLARELGIDVPRELLARADKVIK